MIEDYKGFFVTDFETKESQPNFSIPVLLKGSHVCLLFPSALLKQISHKNTTVKRLPHNSGGFGFLGFFCEYKLCTPAQLAFTESQKG